MSHYLDFESSITDMEALVRALCRVDNRRSRCWNKSQIIATNEAQHLYGYQNDKRSQTAQVIIRRQQVGDASNDIGFVLSKAGTYNAIISEYDQKTHYNTDWLTRLYTFYNVEKSKMELESRNIPYIETKDEQGRLQLRAKFKVDMETKPRIGVKR